MKKTLICTLALFLLCGCDSRNISGSEDEKIEAGTTAAQTTSAPVVTEPQTATPTISATNDEIPATTSAEDDEEFIWLEKGVYECGYGERNYDLPYDNRFEGEFISFFDEKNGVKWDAYEGITAYFTCEQKKGKIVFHEINLTRNNAQAGIGVSYDYEAEPSLDADGNVKLSSSGFLVRLPDTTEVPRYGGELRPEAFDARDFRDNYVPIDDDKPHALGFPYYVGKKIEE